MRVGALVAGVADEVGPVRVRGMVLAFERGETVPWWCLFDCFGGVYNVGYAAEEGWVFIAGDVFGGCNGCVRAETGLFIDDRGRCRGGHVEVGQRQSAS